MNERKVIKTYFDFLKKAGFKRKFFHQINSEIWTTYVKNGIEIVITAYLAITDMKSFNQFGILEDNTATMLCINMSLNGEDVDITHGLLKEELLNSDFVEQAQIYSDSVKRILIAYKIM